MRRSRAEPRGPSGADPEVDDIPVLDDVLAALEAQRDVRAARCERARLGERLERHDFGPDEVLLEIGVDDARRLSGVRAARDRPGPAFVLARRQERDEAEKIVRGTDE